jgi:hypothetical protein
MAEFVNGGEWPNWDEYEGPTLRISGASSDREYERGRINAFVELEEGKLVIRGDDANFVVLDDVTDQTLGRTLLESLGTSAERELNRRRRKDGKSRDL